MKLKRNKKKRPEKQWIFHKKKSFTFLKGKEDKK